VVVSHSLIIALNNTALLVSTLRLSTMRLHATITGSRGYSSKMAINAPTTPETPAPSCNFPAAPVNPGSSEDPAESSSSPEPPVTVSESSSSLEFENPKSQPEPESESESPVAEGESVSSSLLLLEEPRPRESHQSKPDVSVASGESVPPVRVSE
jgi:hypothetical protein